MNGVGQVTDDEISFYRQELTRDGGEIVNRFQQDLVNLSVYKFFGDPITSKFTNKTEYIAMMIATKKLLQMRFVLLPEILCGKVIRLVDRKSINKKYMEKVKMSPTWKKIEALYRNPLKEDQVLSNIAVILSSEFEYISYDDRYLNGTKILIQPEVLYEEFLKFIIYCSGTEDAQYIVWISLILVVYYSSELETNCNTSLLTQIIHGREVLTMDDYETVGRSD